MSLVVCLSHCLMKEAIHHEVDGLKLCVRLQVAPVRNVLLLHWLVAVMKSIYKILCFFHWKCQNAEGQWNIVYFKRCYKANRHWCTSIRLSLKWSLKLLNKNDLLPSWRNSIRIQYTQARKDDKQPSAHIQSFLLLPDLWREILAEGKFANTHLSVVVV